MQALLSNLFSSGTLKSKTFWVGVLQLLLPVLTAYANGGAVGLAELIPVLTGLGTILGRANPDIKPLAQK